MTPGDPSTHALAGASDRQLLRLALSSTLDDQDDDELAAALDQIDAEIETVWIAIGENVMAANLLNATRARLRVVAALRRREVNARGRGGELVVLQGGAG